MKITIQINDMIYESETDLILAWEGLEPNEALWQQLILDAEHAHYNYINQIYKPRFVFHIDTGNMPKDIASEELEKITQKFQKRLTDAETGRLTSE